VRSVEDMAVAHFLAASGRKAYLTTHVRREGASGLDVWPFSATISEASIEPPSHKLPALSLAAYSLPALAPVTTINHRRWQSHIEHLPFCGSDTFRPTKCRATLPPPLVPVHAEPRTGRRTGRLRGGHEVVNNGTTSYQLLRNQGLVTDVSIPF